MTFSFSRFVTDNFYKVKDEPYNVLLGLAGAREKRENLCENKVREIGRGKLRNLRIFLKLLMSTTTMLLPKEMWFLGVALIYGAHKL